MPLRGEHPSVPRTARDTSPARGGWLYPITLRHSRKGGNPALHLVRKANDKFDFRSCLAIHRRHPSEGWDLTSSNEAPEGKERSQLSLG